jgi:ligand-binding sensor domain-containing protein
MKAMLRTVLYTIPVVLLLCLSGCSSLLSGGRWFAATPISTWTSYTTADGLAERHVSAIAIADDGVVWLGTWGGLSRFDGENWVTYTLKQ